MARGRVGGLLPCALWVGQGSYLRYWGAPGAHPLLRWGLLQGRECLILASSTVSDEEREVVRKVILDLCISHARMALW